MAEAFADDFGVDSLLQQDGGVGVAQVVWADTGWVEFGDEAFEGLAGRGSRPTGPTPRSPSNRSSSRCATSMPMRAGALPTSNGSSNVRTETGRYPQALGDTADSQNPTSEALSDTGR